MPTCSAPATSHKPSHRMLGRPSSGHRHNSLGISKRRAARPRARTHATRQCTHRAHPGRIARTIGKAWQTSTQHTRPAACLRGTPLKPPRQPRPLAPHQQRTARRVTGSPSTQLVWPRAAPARIHPVPDAEPLAATTTLLRAGTRQLATLQRAGRRDARAAARQHGAGTRPHANWWKWKRALAGDAPDTPRPSARVHTPNTWRRCTPSDTLPPARRASRARASCAPCRTRTLRGRHGHRTPPACTNQPKPPTSAAHPKRKPWGR